MLSPLSLMTPVATAAPGVGTTAYPAGDTTFDRVMQDEAQEAAASTLALENLVRSVGGQTPLDPLDPGLADLAGEAFDWIDIDGDRILSAKELATTRNTLMGLQSSDRLDGAISFAELLLQLDLNQDGAVTRAEFTRALLSGAKEEGPPLRHPMSLAKEIFQPRGSPTREDTTNPGLPPQATERQDQTQS